MSPMKDGHYSLSFASPRDEKRKAVIVLKKGQHVKKSFLVQAPVHLYSKNEISKKLVDSILNSPGNGISPKKAKTMSRQHSREKS